MNNNQKECQRCGLCCTKGGPALHKKDLSLIQDGIIPKDRLITIRKGELVHKPFSDKPQAAACELIKICGTGKAWQCYYFNNDDKGCRIYTDRPIACSTLKCWDVEEIEKLVEKNTLSRFDIIEDDDPLIPFIEEQQRDCPCQDMYALAEKIENHEYPDLQHYQELVNRDIQIRNRAVREFDISVSEELFYFGRPIFQLLQQLGVRVTEVQKELQLQWPQNVNKSE